MFYTENRSGTITVALKSFVFFAYILISCETETKQLNPKNLFSYSNDSKDYFPEVIQECLDTSTLERFASEYYSRILRRLGEKPLSDEYSGKDVVRLTVIKSFINHFVIRIEKTDTSIELIEKETYRNFFPWGVVDSSDVVIGEHIEFDPARNHHMKVKTKYFHGSDSIKEIAREIIDPIIKNHTCNLTTITWNELVDLLLSKDFYAMRTQLGMTGDDGNHFLIETATKEGYFVVDRWSPRNGDFKDIANLIIDLAQREPED